MIGGKACSFCSDDSNEYISELTRRANAVLKQTAKFAGPSAYTNAVLSVVFLTDELMRTEREKWELLQARKDSKPEGGAENRRPGKNAAKASSEASGQVSFWDLLEDRN